MCMSGMSWPVGLMRGAGCCLCSPWPRTDAGVFTGLLVQGQDLLEWAATSSREYCQLRHLQESEVGWAGGWMGGWV